MNHDHWKYAERVGTTRVAGQHAVIMRCKECGAKTIVPDGMLTKDLLKLGWDHRNV